MTQEQRAFFEEWIAALRSGEYEHDPKTDLKSVMDKCSVMGVACDIALKTGRLPGFYWKYEDEDHGYVLAKSKDEYWDRMLPGVVGNLLFGYYKTNPKVSHPESSYPVSIVHLETEGVRLDVLADLIEARFLSRSETGK